MTNLPYISASYNSAHARARIVTVLLAANAVLNLLAIPLVASDLFLTELTPEQELSDNLGSLIVALLQVGLGLLAFGVYVATVVFFLMWLYRCCQNLMAFGQDKRPIGYSPGWTVGSFFVPIANLFVPYLAVKEVWQKSQPPEPISFAYLLSPPGYFIVWWLLWITSNIAGNVDIRMTLGEAPRDASAIVSVLSSVLSIAAAIFAILVVKEIDRRQEETGRQLPQFPAGSLPPPPPVFQAQRTRPLNYPAQNTTPLVKPDPSTEPPG